MPKGNKDNGQVVDRKEAEFVVIATAGVELPFKGPYPVILDVGAYVWVPASEEALTVNGVVIVTDDRSKAYDAVGTCIVSIPEAWCSFVTEKQAHSMAEALKKEAAQVSA